MTPIKGKYHPSNMERTLTTFPKEDFSSKEALIKAAENIEFSDAASVAVMERGDYWEARIEYVK